MSPEKTFCGEGEWISRETDLLIAEIHKYGSSPRRRARVWELLGRIRQWKRELKERERELLKKRTGFVSNSSSSSFIIGLAKVVDEAKFKKYLEANIPEEDRGDCCLSTVKEIRDKKYWRLYLDQSFLRLSCFSEKEVFIPCSHLKDSDLIFHVRIENNEGDYGAFEYNKHIGGIDYDISIDFFSVPQQKIYDLFFREGIGLEDGSAEFGAARNG